MENIPPFVLVACFLFILELVALLRNKGSWTWNTVLQIIRGLVHIIKEIFSPKHSMMWIERFVCGIVVFPIFVVMVVILCNGAYAGFQTSSDQGNALLCVGVPILSSVLLMLFRINRKYIARS